MNSLGSMMSVILKNGSKSEFVNHYSLQRVNRKYGRERRTVEMEVDACPSVLVLVQFVTVTFTLASISAVVIAFNRSQDTSWTFAAPQTIFPLLNRRIYSKLKGLTHRDARRQCTSHTHENIPEVIIVFMSKMADVQRFFSGLSYQIWRRIVAAFLSGGSNNSLSGTADQSDFMLLFCFLVKTN